MIEPDDAHDEEFFRTFRSLRQLVVHVSEDFGKRLAVRLRAVAAAGPDEGPAALDVFGRTLIDATNIMVGPLSRSSQPPPRSKPPESPESDGEDDEESEDE